MLLKTFKMKSNLLLLTLLLTTISLFAQQKELLLKNRHTQYERFIEAGSKISVSTLPGKFIKGKLNILNDSTIILGSDTINIKTVITIKYTRSILSKITNGILFTGGSFFAYAGISSFYYNSKKTEKEMFMPELVLLITIDGCLLAINSITRYIIPRKYHKKKWDFIICIS